MGGHIFDMVNRIKQSKTQKRKKFKGDNHAMMYSEKLETGMEYTFPNVSESETERNGTDKNQDRENCEGKLP